jgi:uncharacterized DUF497 family protein
MQFTWDARKAQSNLEKHNVRFEVAVEIFRDEGRITAQDMRFDYGEVRLITTGMVEGRLHVVVHVDDESAGFRRIISARKANKRERKAHGTG